MQVENETPEIKILKVISSYRDKLIKAEQTGKWRNTQGLHTAIYSAAELLLRWESRVLSDIRLSQPDYVIGNSSKDVDDKSRAWLKEYYARESLMTGGTRLTLPRAKAYIIDMTQICVHMTATATDYYSSGGVCQRAGRELCDAINILTAVKLTGFKGSDSIESIKWALYSKARIPAKNLVLWGSPEVPARPKSSVENKAPEIKTKAAHGGKREGAGRPKNSIPTARVTFKLTSEQAKKVRQYIATLRSGT